MHPRRFEVVIVGSGYAGIVAAHKLADHRVRVLLLDENVRPGGQFLRSYPQAWSAERPCASDRWTGMGLRLIDRLRQKGVEIMNRTRVLGFYDQGEILVEEDEKRVFTLRPEIILFATGAREKFLPFKGWTLPGVISTGAVQILLKNFGILASREILIGGSGFFLVAVACQFLKNGGRVRSVLDEGSMLSPIPTARVLFKHLPKFLEGAGYLSRTFFSGVPLRSRTRIVEARGEKGLEGVVTSRLNRMGDLIEGSERIYPLDTLAVGFGFCPNIELPQLAGCELEYEEDKGGWIVRVEEGLQTSVENIFAAGEITGIGGARKSIAEGCISALSILCKLGKKAENKSLLRLKKERMEHMEFGKYFNDRCKIPRRAVASIPDETVVCRCEDVRMGEIRKAVQEGAHTPEALKRALRIGMGNCQGKICGPILYDILSLYTRRPAEEIPPFSVRSPIKPLAIRSLLTPGGGPTPSGDEGWHNRPV
ncbi:MAG: FAD-dependent oxidoreductase [Desulfobacterales bacterium]|nr:FAD-dependent oxidoreductase [Desulfobacterales bacterium]